MAQLKSTNVTGNLSVTGNILASKIIKFGGTDEELLLASGKVITKAQLQAAITSNTWRPVKYDTTTLTDSSTTLEFAAGSNIGLTFAGGKLTIANNYSYSLPLAANGTRGGIQIGYSDSTKPNNLAVALDNEKAYIALPSRLYEGRTDSTAPDAATKSGFYYSSSFPASVGFGSNQGTMFVSSYNADWVAQIAIGCYTNKMIFRKKGDGWSTWETVATESWVNEQLGSSGSFDLSKYTEGAASSTDNAIVRFDGTGGKKIQNSTAIISDAGHLSINTIADTTRTTPAIDVLHTGPSTDSNYADLMVLAGYKMAPYGFKFRTYGDGTAIIQSQRISGGSGEKFPLSLNPDGGDVLMNKKLIATQEWVTEQLGSGGSGGSGYVQGSGTANCIPKFTDASTIGDSVISQAASNKTTIGGKLVVNAGADTSSGNCDEGIRILPQNGWSEVFFSNNANITGSGGWIAARRGSAGTTSGAIGDFTIEYGSWQGTGLTLYANGNRPTWNNNELAYKSDFTSSVYDSKVTITTDKSFKSGAGYFTLNQNSDTDIDLALNSSAAGNRVAETVVIAKAYGQIDSMKYTITNDNGDAKASWQYNASTDCVELAWV